MPELTGSFDTAKLPQIAAGAVTVTIARTIKPGTSASFVAASEKLADTVRGFPGCLGATLLHPGTESDEYHMIFRFIDALHLRRWERSDDRERLLHDIDILVVTERVTVTAGEEEFFRAQTTGTPHRTRFGRFFSELLWIYPVSLGFNVIVGPVLGSIPLWGRALIFTLLIGLASRLAVAPLRVRLQRRRMLPQGKSTRRRRR
jgi:antibiotic biosynthesis monooxygenase (ABM) superfamily enzyme